MFRSNTTAMICLIGLSVPCADSQAPRRPEPTIIPRPAEIEALPDSFRLPAETVILVEHGQREVREVGDYLAAVLGERTGSRFRVVELPAGVTTLPGNHILLETRGADPSLGDAGYALTVSNWSVSLVAPTPRGLFHGVQTVRQLLQPGTNGPSHSWSPRDAEWSIPCVRVVDYPRYQWRGMLLDCGRHFMDKEFVKRYIDLLAYHKMNVLHWHLTEDQGWRIEIKRYPKLTEIGAWRKATRDSEQPRSGDRYGGFYSHDDVKEIVEYARSRYVTVVPEIEMPGHCRAALAAYPELSCTGGPFEVGTRWGVYEDVYCAGNDQTFEFLEDVLAEVIDLFPSEYIHIGGDECPKQRWQACPKCQARIKAEGLKDEHELQSYFIRRIEKFLNSKGKRLVGWDEILEGGLAPNATVQSWRGMDGAIAAATAGHDVISSPTSHCYINYAQVRQPGEPTWMGFIDLETCYAFEPTPAQLTPEQAQHVLGLEGNMWTEHAPQQRVDWQVFPRLCALAEVAWSPAKTRDYADFSRRMKTHYRRLDALGVRYYLPAPRCATPDTVFTDSIDVVLDNAFGSGRMCYTLDGSEPTPASPEYTTALQIAETTTVKARTFLPSGRASAVAEFRFERQSPRPPVAVTGLQPGLTYEYYEGDFKKLPDFSALPRVATGVATGIDLAVSRRDGRFALRFTGYLEVPAEGVYTFYLNSDDGSKLWIGPQVVVDHDGLHSATEKRGQVILQAGHHPICVVYFQAGGVRRLEVSYAGPGIAKQPIPPSALWQP